MAWIYCTVCNRVLRLALHPDHVPARILGDPLLLDSPHEDRTRRPHRARYRFHRRHRPGDRPGSCRGGCAGHSQRPQHRQCRTRPPAPALRRSGCRGDRRRRRPFRCSRCRCAAGRPAQGRHPGQQRRHFRPRGLLRDRRRHLGALLADQCDVRRASVAGTAAGDGRRRLGPRAVHLLRIGTQHSRRHDPLRCQQDRAAVAVARPGQARGRQWRHRQRGAARPDPVRRFRGDVRR